LSIIIVVDQPVPFTEVAIINWKLQQFYTSYVQILYLLTVNDITINTNTTTITTTSSLLLLAINHSVLYVIL